MEDNPFTSLKDEMSLLRQEKIKQRESLILEYDEFVMGLLQSLEDTFHYDSPIVRPSNEFKKDNFLEWKISYSRIGFKGDTFTTDIISIKLIFDHNYKPVSFRCKYGISGPDYGTEVSTKPTKEDLVLGLKELYRKL